VGGCQAGEVVKQERLWWGRCSSPTWDYHIFTFVPIECKKVGARPARNLVNVVLESSKVIRWVNGSKQQHIISI